MAKRSNGELTVRVTCIRTPDSDIRIARAVSLILATAQSDEDSDNKHEIKKQGKGPSRSGNEYQGDSPDTG